MDEWNLIRKPPKWLFCRRLSCRELTNSIETSDQQRIRTAPGSWICLWLYVCVWMWVHAEMPAFLSGFRGKKKLLDMTGTRQENRIQSLHVTMKIAWSGSPTRAGFGLLGCYKRARILVAIKRAHLTELHLFSENWAIQETTVCNMNILIILKNKSIVLKLNGFRSRLILSL